LIYTDLNSSTNGQKYNIYIETMESYL
jgi:hypothetical protein